ncbi:hypothetical protein C8Q74DRAFT_1219380 [Fomes fomentarius]|nr:hypothetical protein C8Q74DRAFT_1219380 [Fomes fomentarius]
MPGANPDFKKQYQEKVEAERDAFRQFLLNADVEDLMKWGFLRRRRGSYVFVGAMQNGFKNGKARADEEFLYKEFKEFLPPDELRKRRPGFNQAWEELTKTGEIEPATHEKVTVYIDSKWKPNITIFDLKCADPMVHHAADGYPCLQLDMFGTINCFDYERDSDSQVHRGIVAWRTCNTFFEEAAAALKALESYITFEFIVGGLSEELAKMRRGRPGV